MLSQITSFLMLLKDMLFGSTHYPSSSSFTPTSLSTASRGRDILLNPRPQTQPPLAELLFCSTPDCKRNCYVVPREEGRWIAISSLFFIGPGIYSYYKLLPYHSLMIFICSAISSNYWREPTYGWRRDMDLMYAKFIFTVFFSSGLYYIRNPSYMAISYPSAVALIYCYYMSNKLSTNKNKELNHSNWYKYHMMYHAIMTGEAFLIIHSMTQIKS